MEVMARRRGMRAHETLPLSAAETWAARGGLDHPIDGQVFGLALNTQSERAALADAFGAAPYKAAPIAPVVYLKSPNTRAFSGAAVALPAGADHLTAAPTLALVIGATTCRVPAERILDHVMGVVPAIDLSLPQADYFRPAVREQCRDGFLPLCPWITPLGAVDLGHAGVTLSVNDQPALRLDLSDLHRPIAALLADLSDFMTLAPGDAVLCGVPAPVVTVRAGDVLSADAPGIGRVTCEISPKRAGQ
jgi:5-oxopent-3-ene-1,2,5-tricarboxylate decarboxylase/2-hydroxyhepta-2,4-diene-1,7-dioate isomerase